jgi:putative hemolysin
LDSISGLFNGFSIPAIVSLVITILLLGASAFMSASEIAFFSLSPNDINKLNEHKKTDKLIIQLRSNPEKLLATILIGNNLVNIGAITIATYCNNQFFNFSRAPLLGFLFESVIITFLLLLFGEVMPKIYANRYSKKVAAKGAGVLRRIEFLLTPFSYILVNSSSLINKRLVKYNHTNISMDELSHALQLTAQEEDEDTEILEGIVNFGSTTVNKVMTSRLDMLDVDVKSSYKNVLNVIIESGYSRIPVYQGSKDNIRGILYTKDLLPHLEKNEAFRWQSLIRPAYFVPETKKINDLLADFQKNRIHIAIVVDEFGGTSGLVTMEDILEEIVGEIKDEYDDEEPQYKKIEANTFIFEAKILLNDFFKIEGIDESLFDDIADDVETLAGLILQLEGEIPAEKEVIKYKNYVFEILSADNRRIETVKLHINPEEKTDKN